MKNEQPNKKKTGRKKVKPTEDMKPQSSAPVSSAPIPQAIIIPVPPPENEQAAAPNELQSLIQNSIKKFITNEMQDHSDKIKDMKILESLVSEYLKCFMVIGYDLFGNQIILQHARNQQDQASLTESIRMVFTRIFMQPP